MRARVHDVLPNWAEAHVAGPFDLHQAPVAGGEFIGDYEGMTTNGTAFQPFFIQAVSGADEPDGRVLHDRSIEGSLGPAARRAAGPKVIHGDTATRCSRSRDLATDR